MPPQIRPVTDLPAYGANTRNFGLRLRARHLPFVLVIPFLFLVVWTRQRAPIPFHYPMGPPTGNTSFSPTLEQQIPPYVHYVFGLSPSYGGKPFAFLQYVCLMSALQILKPEVIYMHYVFPPRGWFWDQFVSRVNESGRTRLAMVKQRDVTSIFGNDVEHFAHKADVIRLEVLRDYGGVYLDTDVLVIKDLSPLYKHGAVLAMESQPNLDPALPPSGLCNAVILSKPYSSFIVRWIDSYRSFDKSQWASHSVTKPWSLAQQYPLEVTVLNKFAFFWPLWHDDHLRIIHRDTAYSFHTPSSSAPTWDTQFTYHLWQSVAWDRYLQYYDPDRIHNVGPRKGDAREEDGRSDECSFSREARRWVSNSFREEWRSATASGLLK